MSSKTCTGCNLTLPVNTRTDRLEYSYHLKNCKPYQESRTAKFADKDEGSKDAQFLHMLDSTFTEDQKYSILEAIKYYLEG